MPFNLLLFQGPYLRKQEGWIAVVKKVFLTLQAHVAVNLAGNKQFLSYNVHIASLLSLDLPVNFGRKWATMCSAHKGASIAVYSLVVNIPWPFSAEAVASPCLCYWVPLAQSPLKSRTGLAVLRWWWTLCLNCIATPKFTQFYLAVQLLEIKWVFSGGNQ